MNQADIKKAQSLSTQFKALGFGKATPKKIVKKSIPSKLFSYESLKPKEDTSLSQIRAATKAAQDAAKSAADLALTVENMHKRVISAESTAKSAASSAASAHQTAESLAAKLVDKPAPIEHTKETTVIQKVETEPFLVTTDIVKDIIKVMHSLPDVDKLEVSKGIRNASSFIYKGTRYGTEELMHGGSSSSSSGSAFQQPVSGAVDGVNATYTWTTAPNVIVVDQGRPMQKVSSDGTVNWTGTTVTVLTIAPNFDIFATG